MRYFDEYDFGLTGRQFFRCSSYCCLWRQAQTPNVFGIDNFERRGLRLTTLTVVEGRVKEMTFSGQRVAIKNANVSIQCEFYANDKVKSKIRATLW